ncbi:MAG TPA: hypothetical protein VJT49_23120 [Amycolatopsis sp.]|uniref:hypothetical protein n=1 Tax=Amycolatopsis sp. TaxID=37632 RepID=UPI002B4776E4|nr:hypothetical protein [Amycolatopsis sp.]HKS47949.1 hypothetical protein [Amycolatopsis sp.]
MATWNRPMTVFAGVMGVMGFISLGGLFFDDRILLGAPIWLKPFKFAVSFAIYCLTWAWLTSKLTRGKRLANRVAAGLVALLAAEYVIIATQTVRGRPSHFNVATPFDRTLYVIMGVSAAGLWIGTMALTVPLLRQPIADTASRLAIRIGMVISVVGIGLGALMVTRPAGQAGAQGVIGAHTVGARDGGPGMPITGWSTIGGDLRIPHFVGMHALQALPLFVVLLGLLARRFPRLGFDTVRGRLVWIAGGVYGGLVALVTWQALRGQSLIHPDGLTLTALGVLVGAALATTVLTLAPSPRRAAVEPRSEEVVR